MTDDMKSSAEDPQTQEEEPDAVSQDEVTDEFVDEVSESLLGSDAVATAEAEEGEAEEGEGEEQAEEEDPELEEEKVKDEIDIQIDLLQDTDWVVRREAVVTLGEMGDERCVEPIVRTLRDGTGRSGKRQLKLLLEWGLPPSSCCSGTCAIGSAGSTQSRHWGRSMMSGCWIP